MEIVEARLGRGIALNAFVVAAASAAGPSIAAGILAVGEYGAWLRDDHGPTSTRMVVQEQAPSGDEQADFADMLKRFKQGIAENVEEILGLKVIGVIPESETVLDASNQGLPAIHLAGTDVSEAYKDVVARFLGEERPMRFVDAEKPGFFKRLFGGR